MSPQNAELIQQIRREAHPLSGARADYNPLLELIGDRRFVLLGEVPETFPSAV
jgi:erythromycin esterase-like protein